MNKYISANMRVQKGSLHKSHNITFILNPYPKRLHICCWHPYQLVEKRMPWGGEKKPHHHISIPQQQQWQRPRPAVGDCQLLLLLPPPFLNYSSSADGPSPTLFHYHMPPQGFRHHIFFCYADCWCHQPAAGIIPHKSIEHAEFPNLFCPFLTHKTKEKNGTTLNTLPVA